MKKNRQNKKIALLLHVARKQAIGVYNTFAFSQEEEGVYDSVIAKFDAYCNPKKNETYERYVVNSRKQLAGKSVEHFVTDLKLKAQTCQVDVLRDRIILGVSSQRVRERLLREDDLNLEKAIKVCQAAEATEKQISALTGPGRDTSREVSVNYCATTTRSKRSKYLNLRPVLALGSVGRVTRTVRTAISAGRVVTTRVCADRHSRHQNHVITCHVMSMNKLSCLSVWWQQEVRVVNVGRSVYELKTRRLTSSWTLAQM